MAGRPTTEAASKPTTYHLKTLAECRSLQQQLQTAQAENNDLRRMITRSYELWKREQLVTPKHEFAPKHGSTSIEMRAHIEMPPGTETRLSIEMRQSTENATVDCCLNATDLAGSALAGGLVYAMI